MSLSPDGGADAKPSAQPASHAVSVRGLTKRYGDSVAVRSLSLDVTGRRVLDAARPERLWEDHDASLHPRARDPDEGRILFGDDVIVDCTAKTAVPVHRRDVGIVCRATRCGHT